MTTYKFKLVLISSLIFCSLSYAASQSSCPKVIKPLLDWAIPPQYTAAIPTGQAFQGNNLTFSVIAKPRNTSNIVSINPQTGEVHINAKFGDQFDITVLAKNPCGQIAASFNVIIDEGNSDLID
ncbi:hypothetical protein Lnau_1769 [Legionella nautarum]|uniref:Cadherin domain-containing protein n=1 Tax=Legionella nautarum TaxID=45070 RepID=A0A0W0WWX1_9GAMM|nr:hypothetical protein [Legionella nautarum]KTD36785.1 hypothetical protein Lnau_1769 [Legionella nautarum]